MPTVQHCLTASSTAEQSLEACRQQLNGHVYLSSYTISMQSAEHRPKPSTVSFTMSSFTSPALHDFLYIKFWLRNVIVRLIAKFCTITCTMKVWCTYKNSQEIQVVLSGQAQEMATAATGVPFLLSWEPYRISFIQPLASLYRKWPIVKTQLYFKTVHLHILLGPSLPVCVNKCYGLEYKDTGKEASNAETHTCRQIFR